IKDSHNHSIKALSSNSNLSNNSHSLGLFDLKAGTYKVTVKADRATTGDFSLNLYLAGDANGTRAVDSADKALIQRNLGKKTGQIGYTAAEDANLNGKIDSFDVTAATKNSGDKTKVTLLTLSALLTPAPAALPNG